MARLSLPELVRGTVLIAPYGAPYSQDELARVFDTFTVTDWQKARAFTNKIFPNGVPIPGLTLTSLILWANVNRPHLTSLRGAAATYPLLQPHELSEMPPTLLMWGDKDFILPATGLDFFSAYLPRQRTEVISEKRYSHMPFIDFPEQVATQIKTWAAKHQLLA